MNKLRMTIIIRDIEKFFSDLEEMNVKKESDLRKKEKFYAVSMLLFSIVNRAIDLGEEIISYKSLGFPEKYRDIFSLLRRGKIIGNKTAEELSDLVYYRNMAAHEYHEYTEKELFEFYKRIAAVKDFIERVKKIK